MPSLPTNQEYLSINDAALLLKVATKTLRRWEANGRLVTRRTAGGHRRYLKSELIEFKKK